MRLVTHMVAKPGNSQLFFTGDEKKIHQTWLGDIGDMSATGRRRTISNTRFHRKLNGEQSPSFKPVIRIAANFPWREIQRCAKSHPTSNAHRISETYAGNEFRNRDDREKNSLQDGLSYFRSEYIFANK